MVIFCLQVWEGAADSKKTKRLSQEEIKKQLLESIIINEAVESEELSREAKKVQDPEEATIVIQKYECIIKMKKKGIISIEYHQDKVFKNFKDKEKFVEIVSRLGIHKSTIVFKIHAFKLCERYPKLLKSSIGSGFFKNYHKDIKAVCIENAQEFS